MLWDQVWERGKDLVVTAAAEPTLFLKQVCPSLILFPLNSLCELCPILPLLLAYLH